MKMKKKLASLLVLTFCISSMVVGCSSSGSGTQTTEEPTVTVEEQGDGSWERVVEAGKITVGLDDAYPPMGYRDTNTGELIGFDIEMAQAIGEKLGIEFEMIPAEWNSIVPSILAGNFDTIISGMNMWSTRKEVVDFVPYGVASQVIIVKADNAAIDEIDGIEYFLDKTIGSQLGSTGAKVAMSYGFEDSKNLMTYKAFPDSVLDLENGRIDAIIIDNFGASELITTGDYVIVGDPVVEKGEDPDTAKIGIAVRKEDKELRDKLQGAVDELIADGTLGELSMKWIGIDITADL